MSSLYRKYNRAPNSGISSFLRSHRTLKSQTGALTQLNRLSQNRYGVLIRRPLRRVGSKMDRKTIKGKLCLSQTDDNLLDHSFQEVGRDKKERETYYVDYLPKGDRARGDTVFKTPAQPLTWRQKRPY